MPTNNTPVKYAVVAETGEIVRIGQCAPESMDAQYDVGEMLVLEPDGVSDDTHYWDGEAFAEYPPRPDDRAVFDFDQMRWVDPRTPADLAAELDARRAAARLTKGQFLAAAMAHNLLNPAEAKQAAMGVVPDAYEPAVAAMSAEARDRLAIDWPTATHVARNDPALIHIAQYKKIAEDELDEMFGVQPPPPFYEAG